MTNHNPDVDPTPPQPSTECQVPSCLNEGVFITLDGDRLCNSHIQPEDLGENFDFSEPRRFSE